MPEILGVEIPFGRGKDDDPTGLVPSVRGDRKDRVERIVEAAAGGLRANVNVEALRPRIQQAIDQGLDDQTIVGLVQGFIGNTPEERTKAVTELFERPAPQADTKAASASGGSANPAQVAQTILASALQAAPDPSDYDNPEDYTFAYQDWLSVVQSAQTVSQSLKEQEAGLIRMDDGSIITQAQFDNLDPFAQQQVVAAYSAQNTKIQNDYNDLLNTLDLSEYQTAMNAADTVSSVASRNFQNKLSEYQQQVANQQATQQTAVHQIARQLGGMQESRLRADSVSDAQREAAPWATQGGKTSFSAGDLGSGVARLAGFGGMRPDLPFLNFTGTTNIDPGALMAAGDASLGVGGALPEIPELNLGPVPTAPQSAVPNMPIPTMRRPQMPTLIPIPYGASPNPELAGRGG